MVQTASQKNLITEQIVCSVLADDALDLREQIHRASRSFDQNTAASFVVALLEQLTMHPDSVREHEALVILGIAHPRVLRDQKVHLGHEGRRLAAKLETLGEAERAQELLEVLAHNDPRDRGVDKDLASIMRRTGNIDRLVERYLFRAEQAVGDGRRRDAITWLREVLMLDRSRRDVARMIRDLQYESRQVKEGWKRFFRLVGLVLVLAGLGVGLVYREMHVARSYANLEQPEPGNVDSLRQHLSTLDSLIAGNPLWLGMFKAGRERAAVRAELDRLDAAQADAARLAADGRFELAAQAEAARVAGRLLVEQRDYSGAVEQFRKALEVAPADWSWAERTRSNIEFLEELPDLPHTSSQDSDR